MKIKQAVQILESHNKWRRCGDGDMTEPEGLGIAIDTIVAYHLEVEKQDFITKCISKVMDKNKYPYGLRYMALLADVTEDAENKWKIKLKLKK